MERLTFHNLLVAVGLLTCFSAIFYMYYEPTANWLKCPGVPNHEVCQDICINALQMLNHTQLVNNTCIVNLTSIRNHFTQTDPDQTILLIWMWPFGHEFELGSCGLLFDIHGCHLTDDRSQFNHAHGVLFHHRDIRWDLSNMPKLPRPPLQKWIWMNMESPSNSPRYSHLDSLFNLTSTYKKNSDIAVPYGRIKVGGAHFKLPAKNKLVCWIVSNWNSAHKRSKYYEQLKEHIDIETYGNSFSRHISDEHYSSVVSSCKFYLSFENSIHKDYITEKLFNPLALGTVPVVLGPPRSNYEDLIPGGAFIHVDDFSSPKELAEHLKLLDQDEDSYMRYFTWREHFTSSTMYFGLEHACRACVHIRRYRSYRVVNDLDRWFWG